MSGQSNDNIIIPIDELKARERKAMLQAKKKRKVRNTIKRSFLVACGLCLSLLGSGFVSTGMAEALNNIPLIGSIYKDFRDIASEKVERDNLATLINKSDSQNGITMTVKEAAYDGSRLMVSIIYTGDKELDMSGVNSFGYVTINGQPVQVASGQGGQDDIDSYTVIEHRQLTFANYDQYGDEIEVTVHGEDLFGYESDLEVSFDLQKVSAKATAFYPEVSATTDDGLYTLKTEKVIFTPLATRIDLNADYPLELNEDDKWPAFEYYVQDSEGQVYDGLTLQQGMVPGNYGHQIVLTLPPFDVIPASLTFVPLRTDKEGEREEITELKLVVPLLENE